MADKDLPERLAWLPACFNQTENSATHVSGWVENEAQLETVIEAHKRATLCSFVAWSDDKKKKKKKARRILWTTTEENDSTYPYSVDRYVVLTCQYGPPRGKTKHDSAEVKKKVTEGSEDHQYIKKQRFLIQTSRKVGCAARLYIRYITRYDGYGLPFSAGRKSRQTQLDCLTEKLDNKDIVISKLIFLNLPLADLHTNHVVSIESAFANRIHRQLREEIKTHVSMGVTSVVYIKRALQNFVQKEMCKDGQTMPSKNDRCYYPTNRDIRNCVHQALVAGQYSGLDQENLEHKIEMWANERPNDRFFLRKCSGEEDTSHTVVKTTTVFVQDEDETTDEEDKEIDLEVNKQQQPKNSFLWVHQNQDQRKLLAKYGNMVLMDATYKTTKYALPLFLLVVRTNVAYIPVGEFIVESETTDNIKEALEVVKGWNPEWCPSYFMLDYSDQEYQALHQVFPDACKYLCYFHVEQAWIRWTKQREKTNLSETDREILLESLRKIASAPTIELHNAAVEDLTNLRIFQNNLKVQTYLKSRWLNIPERWCRAFAQEGFHVNVTTNNGVESLNNSLKTFYTKLLSSGTLTSLVEILVEAFIPDQLKTYIQLNYQFSSQYKKYNEHVPQFLHNMPRNVVKHCLHRYASARDYTENDVDDLGESIFYVKSQSEPNQVYSIDFGSEQRSPSCSCLDFTRTFLPCKHIFAVLQNTKYNWTDLSPLYRSSPYLKLDDDFLSKEALEVVCEEPDDLSTHLNASLSNTSCQGSKSDDEDTNIFKSRQKLRENLKIMDDLSFLTKDSEALCKVNMHLPELIEILKKSVSMEANLPLHQGETVKLEITSKSAKRQLPKRARRAKKTQSRKRARTISSAADENICGVKVDSQKLPQKLYQDVQIHIVKDDKSEEIQLNGHPKVISTSSQRFKENRSASSRDARQQKTEEI